jgi:hypothetical protein
MSRDLARRLRVLERGGGDGQLPPVLPLRIVIRGGLPDANDQEHVLPNGMIVVGGLPDPETLQ